MSDQKQPLLPTATLTLSIVVLLAGLAECAGAIVLGTKIPYDSQFMPLVAFGLIGVSLLTIVAALIAAIQHGGWRTVTALLLSITSFVVAVLGLFVVIGVMLANHPI